MSSHRELRHCHLETAKLLLLIEYLLKFYDEQRDIHGNPDDETSIDNFKCVCQ